VQEVAAPASWSDLTKSVSRKELADIDITMDMDARGIEKQVGLFFC